MQLPSVPAQESSTFDSVRVDPISGVGDAVGMITDKLEGWGESAIRLLPNFGVALLVLLLFWLAARAVASALGQLVESNGYLGVVSDIRLRVTILRLFTGQTVRIPNREVLTNAIVNYTETGERRVDIAVGVSYGSDLDEVKRVTIEAIEPLDCRREERPVELFYEAFGDSSINFQLRFWMDVTRQPDFLAARSDAIMAIKRAYDRAGITIPFPIRTLDFGIKGGQTITDALEPVLVR